MEIDVNVLTSPWAIAGVIGSIAAGFVTLFLGVMAYKAIKQTARIHKTQLKLNLLDRIAAWGEEYRLIPLLKLNGDELLNKYQVLFSTNPSIVALTNGAFKTELMEDVENANSQIFEIVLLLERLAQERSVFTVPLSDEEKGIANTLESKISAKTKETGKPESVVGSILYNEMVNALIRTLDNLLEQIGLVTVQLSTS